MPVPDVLDTVAKVGDWGFADQVPPPLPEEATLTPPELIVQPNDQVRQAGATQADTPFIQNFKRLAERDLFVFSKGVMGRDYLTKSLHLSVCRFLQNTPPHRKLVLMPREHAKTSLVSHCLPVHILIQPAEDNIYFTGLEGCECRILMAGETAAMASKNLRVVTAAFAENALVKAFWPHRTWANPRSESKMWNNEGIILPRETEWPDPSIRAIGVGGAITGARPNVMIKDDLVSFAAANSPTVMHEAIEWHKVSRALLEEYEVESGLQSLEHIVGTRWAVYDLYSDIMDNDPSVEVIDSKFHRIIKDGVILWPERITEAFIEEKRREYGPLYYLLYLNSTADPSLTDFDLEMLREFTFHNGAVAFEEDERDAILLTRLEEGKLNGETPLDSIVRPKGMGLNSTTYDAIIGDVPKGRGEFMRFKYG